MEREWVTVQEMANAIEVSSQTVLNWIKAGHLEANRVGPRLLRIPRSEFERVMREAGQGGR